MLPVSELVKSDTLAQCPASPVTSSPGTSCLVTGYCDYWRPAEWSLVFCIFGWSPDMIVFPVWRLETGETVSASLQVYTGKLFSMMKKRKEVLMMMEELMKMKEVSRKVLMVQ